jgi:hypothetical protein
MQQPSAPSLKLQGKKSPARKPTLHCPTCTRKAPTPARLHLQLPRILPVTTLLRNLRMGDNQRHPYQSNIQSPFQMMRSIEEDIFQGLSIEDIHKKYIITQDTNTCILCRFRSNRKRYHHTKDCREIKATQELYYKADNDTKKDVSVYLVSNPCSRAFDTTPVTHQICHDTGSPLHLFNHKAFFSSIKYFPTHKQPSVALGDDKTLLPIIGYGYADFIMQHKRIRLKAFYVPSLGINLYSPTRTHQVQWMYLHTSTQQNAHPLPNIHRDYQLQ